MHGTIPRPSSTSPPPSEWRELLTDVGNMLKAFIGLNSMYVAYAFSKAGLVRGTLGLLLITLLTEHCCLLLVHVKNSLPGYETPPISDSDPSDMEYGPVASDDVSISACMETPPSVTTAPGPAPTYGDIANSVGGPFAEHVVNAALVLTQFGYCVGYLIFLSETLHDLLPSATQATLPASWLVLLPIPALMALGLLASIRSLGPFSIIANAALLFGFVAVVTFILRHFHWQPGAPALGEFPLFFGQMTAALEGIGLVLPVESSMRKRERFPIVLRIALGTLALVLLVVGVLGFATYGDHTASIILVNFSDGKRERVVNVVKVVLMIGILFTYPLQIIPVFQFFESLLPRGRQEDEVGCASDGLLGRVDGEEVLFVREWGKIAVRLGIVLLTAMVAFVAGRRFGLVQSLVGSLGASCLAYTAPALLHVVAFRRSIGWGVWIKDVGIIIFGVVGAIVGTGVTMMAFFRGESG